MVYGGLDHPVMKVSMTIRGGRHFFTGKDPYQGRVSRHGLFVFPGWSTVNLALAVSIFRLGKSLLWSLISLRASQMNNDLPVTMPLSASI